MPTLVKTFCPGCHGNLMRATDAKGGRACVSAWVSPLEAYTERQYIVALIKAAPVTEREQRFHAASLVDAVAQYIERAALRAHKLGTGGIWIPEEALSAAVGRLMAMSEGAES